MKYLQIYTENSLLKEVELGNTVFPNETVEIEYHKRFCAKAETLKKWDEEGKIIWDHLREDYEISKEVPGGIYAFEIACIDEEMKYKIKTPEK